MPVLRILILVVAVGAGGVAAWLAVMREAPEPQVVEVAAPVDALPQVLVAVNPLALGQIATEADFAWRDWPESAISPAFIRRDARPDARETLAEQIVRSAIVAGEPVIADKLGDRAAGFMASLLDSGKRAVAVRVTAESAVAGFVLPGDRVDLVHTYKPDDGAMRSVTLLTNVKVLAIDQRATETRDGALLGKTATLELEPSEVETVVAAERSGALSLSLRSAADFSDDPVSPVDAGLKALAAAMLDAELAKRATPPAKGAPLQAKPAVVAAEFPAPDENLLIRVRRGAADVQTVTLN